MLGGEVLYNDVLGQLYGHTMLVLLVFFVRLLTGYGYKKYL